MKKIKMKTKIVLWLLFAMFVIFDVFCLIALIGSRAILFEIEKIEAVATRDLEFSKATTTQNAFLKNDSSNSDFNILHISDIHFVCSIFSFSADKKALDTIVELVNKTKPDFIVVTGDLVYTVFYNGSINNIIAIEAIGNLFEAFEIPWTVTYGNHDAEFFYLMSKSEQTKYFESLPHCLFVEGPSHLTGEGNFVVELQNFDGSLNTALFMLDSNSYDGMFGVYDFVRDDQVDWFESTANLLNQQQNKAVNSLVFLHIPLFEYRLAEQSVEEDPLNLLRGENSETISSTSKTDGKLFETIVQLKNLGKLNTKAVFCGHDHINHTAIRFSGVVLSYGMSIEYSAYVGNRNQHRGGQVVKIDKDGNVKIALAPLVDNFNLTEWVEV